MHQPVYFIFAVAVAAIISSPCWHARQAVAGETQISASNAPAAPPQTNSFRQPIPPPVNTATTTAVASVPQSPPQTKSELINKILSAYNHVPIDFCGKLEDQFGDPVAGAVIKGSIRVISGLRQGTDWPTTTSDANGLFQLHGTGQDISMMPVKEGYALASLSGGGNYSRIAPDEERAHPNPNHPVVIKMWRLQGATPLVGINQTYKLHYTNEPIFFDLIAGQIVNSGGDIKLLVNRSPGLISGRNRFDWSVQVEAVNGGLMDSAGQERITYMAPGAGYEPRTNIIFSTTAPYKWYGGFSQGFFGVSRNGQVYTKIAISFNINDEPDGLMSIVFRGIASTNGSRNWEGDSNTYNPNAVR